MATCDGRRDLIWEDLFGLLDTEASERLHEHLLACRTCQAERQRAEAGQSQLARAARLDVAIPPFTAPSEAVALPLAETSRPAWKPSRDRLWPWLAAAAALLLLGVSYGLYHHGLARRENALREAQRQAEASAARRKQAASQGDREAAALLAAGRAQHVRLQLLGPADYQPGAANPYRVRATYLDGTPAETRVQARLLGPQDRVLFQTERLAARGDVLISLPANLSLRPEDTARLEVTAAGPAAPELLREPLPVSGPAYLTHLALDRTLYRPGERVFFRSLTLDRFALTPPGQRLRVAYVVRDGQGVSRHALTGGIRPDGIGGGEFVVPRDAAAGEYAVTVTEAENRFPPVTRRFLVRPPSPGRLPKTAPGEPAGSPRPAAPHALRVEFFPEGGDLVAGQANRVYFRVRTPQDRPADLEGDILDARGQRAAAVRTADPKGLGLGVFAFTPRAGETYRLRITSPAGVTLPSPVLPAVRGEGVALSIPTGVTHEGEAIHAVLRQSGPERQAVVGAFCRGRLVAGQAVTLRPGATGVQLTPAPGCSGVVRVTVFDAPPGESLRPLAERLIYRVPSQRLQLTVRGAQERYNPGEPVQLGIRARNEKGEPESAWLLVAVVNEEALVQGRGLAELSGPADFYVASDLERPEELERADFLLSEDPRAPAALDFFLGTQGWRRFAEPEARTARAGNSAGADRATAGMMHADNAAQVEEKAAAAMAGALAARYRELDEEAERQLEEARAAARALAAYRERVRTYGRLGMGLAAAGLFLGGCALLAAALVRLLRGLARRRRYLAGAFAALSLCVFAVLGTGQRPGNLDNPTELPILRQLARELQQLRASQPLRKAVPNLFAGKPAPPAPAAGGQTTAPGGIASRSVAPANPLAVEEWPRDFASLMQDSPKATGPRGRNSDTEKSNEAEGSRGPGQVLRLSPGGRLRPIGQPHPEAAPPLPLREYAYQRSRAAAGQEVGETLLWQPVLLAVDGTARVTFELPGKAAVYCIRVEGHSAAGRLGAAQQTLRVR